MNSLVNSIVENIFATNDGVEESSVPRHNNRNLHATAAINAAQSLSSKSGVVQEQLNREGEGEEGTPNATSEPANPGGPFDGISADQAKEMQLCLPGEGDGRGEEDEEEKEEEDCFSKCQKKQQQKEQKADEVCDIMISRIEKHLNEKGCPVTITKLPRNSGPGGGGGVSCYWDGYQYVPIQQCTYC